MSSTTQANFTPKIVAFVCNWCAYGATESAGVTEHQYPATVKMIRVICSGRVERALILKAIEEGIDGIIVLTCNIGNCHYMDGNIHAKKRIEATASLLRSFGIEKERVKFQEIRASEGNNLSKYLTEFSNEIIKLGPIKKLTL